MRLVALAVALVDLGALFAASPAHAQPAPAPAPAPPSTLRLEDAVQLALSRNERARIAELNVTVAAAGVDRARAAFLPVLLLTGSDQQHAYPSTDRQPNNIATTAITVNQPLLNASAFPLYAQAKNNLEGTHP